MKNLAKVGVLCLALAILVAALHVGAATTTISSQVSLTLLEGSNTCMLDDYAFVQLKAAPSDQVTEELTGNVTCTFLKNSAEIVSLQMKDLSSNMGINIPASGFNAQISSGITQGSIGILEDKKILSFDGPHTIYEKAENTIGAFTGTLTLQGIIPGGTPGGTYTGSIELVLQYGGN